MDKMTQETGQKEHLTRSATSRTIKYLFATLHARYGSKWSSQVPDELWPVAQEQWLRILSSFTLSDIKRGLDTWHEDWPPNVFEFEKACRPPEPKRELYKALDPPRQTRCSKEKAKENTENLKLMIKEAKLRLGEDEFKKSKTSPDETDEPQEPIGPPVGSREWFKERGYKDLDYKRME